MPVRGGAVIPVDSADYLVTDVDYEAELADIMRASADHLYSVKETFYTLQGEAGNAGHAAVFVRFAGCNLWSGRQGDRDRGRPWCAQWCDTDFVGTDGPGGGRYSADALAAVVARMWPNQDPLDGSDRLVVCTGGEPTLQMDKELIAAFHLANFRVAIETNGTRPTPQGVDYICVSPKGRSFEDLKQRSGSELKLVYPQPELTPDEVWAQRETLDFPDTAWFLSPMDVADPVVKQQNVDATVRYVLEHPWWRLSLQTHKIVGVP